MNKCMFEDVDECKQRPCDINEICENTVGSFKCHCKSGFQLDNITNACIGNNNCYFTIFLSSLSSQAAKILLGI